MANYNKVILLGNLTRDPQLSYLPSQTPVCEFGLAVSRRWRGPTGEQREETCFIDCRCYGKQAETFNQYMTKGRPVLVEGRLEFNTWEGPDGQKRSKHRVNVMAFQFMDAARQGGAGGGAPRPQAQPQRQAPPPPAGAAPEAPPPEAAPPDAAPPPAPQEEYEQPPPDFQGGEEIPF